MRVMMRMEMPAAAGNKAVSDGTLGKIVQDFAAKWKPEAAYFGTFDGNRTMFTVFDLPSPSDVPVIAEPFFMGLNAKLEIIPVMNMDDLQKGLSQV